MLAGPSRQAEHDTFLLYNLPSLSATSPDFASCEVRRKRVHATPMRVRPTASGLVLAIVLASGVASADALRCASTIESESARYVQAVVKALARCED